MIYNGVFGIFNYRNGGKYDGKRKHGRKEGTGTYYYANGDIYMGQWENDLMEGTGTYYHYASGSKYEGQWENGLPEGIGTFYNSRGLQYIGEWLKGRRKVPYFHKKQYVMKVSFHDISCLSLKKTVFIYNTLNNL